MTSNDEEAAEIARMLEMTEQELRTLIAARGLDWDTEIAKLDAVAQAEILEKALFGATLDDIVNASDIADLEIRPVGFIRQNQEAASASLGPARPRRDDGPHARPEETAPAREASAASRPARSKP